MMPANAGFPKDSIFYGREIPGRVEGGVGVPWASGCHKAAAAIRAAEHDQSEICAAL